MKEKFRICSRCDIPKPFTEFYDREDAKEGKRYWCIECNKEWNKRRWQEHKPELQEYHRNYRRIVRGAALFVYSDGTMQCAICGCDEYGRLCIHHPDNDGTAHRKALGINGGGGVAFALWLRKNGYPSGYGVLCNRCNPKQRKKEISTSLKTE